MDTRTKQHPYFQPFYGLKIMTGLSRQFCNQAGELNPFSGMAFLAIDVQRGFCDPTYHNKRGTNQTEFIAKAISSFHKDLQSLRFPSILVYADRKSLGISRAQGGLFGVAHTGWDIILSKEMDSVFSDQNKNDNIGILKAHGYDHLIISGFNANACVKTSVFEARLAGFGVTILEDLVGQDNGSQIYFNTSPEKALSKAFEGYKKAGAKVTTSYDFLQTLRGSCLQAKSFEMPSLKF